MKLKIGQKRVNTFSRGQLKRIVDSLQQGNVIAFPTETVYALAGDARNLTAIKKIFALKNRPLNQPLSVLLPENYNFELWVTNVSSLARHLAACFWPGPLTLILNKNETVLPELTGGQSKIGLRVPDHPIAQAILQGFTSGLAAPSANRSTYLSSTQLEHVQQAFSDQLDIIIDGGECSVGIESTIVDVTSTIPRILRLGAISQAKIQNVVNCEVILDTPASMRDIRLPIQEIAISNLKSVISEYLSYGKSVTVLARHSSKLAMKNLIWINMPKEAFDYARVLYKYLREAENLTDKILIEALPTDASWIGIRHILGKY
ncbi:MAG: L-threonylcarbamoyladenylate synthase [Rickettsiella sp.]|nr:L-threonylcarbamoyladenylate synthase [Rickettsiella sp.]